jgi:ferredoxin-type protein NapH
MSHATGNSWIQPVRVAGMLLLLGALSYAISLLFMGSYRLDAEQMDRLFGERAELIRQSAPEFEGRTVKGKAAYLRVLRDVSERSSVAARARDGLSAEDIAGMAERQAGQPFDLKSEQERFRAMGLETKAGSIGIWLGWFDGRTMSKEDIVKAFSAKAEVLNARISGMALSPAAATKILREAAAGPVRDAPGLTFWLTFGLAVLGALMHILPGLPDSGGIRNNGVQTNGLNSRGAVGMGLGVLLIAFYIILYWYPVWIAEWTLLVDPISFALSGGPANQWFLYGWLYTLAVVVMGVRFAIKYRHSRYQLMRTASVTFFQIGFAFLLSNLLPRFQLPARDLKNIWPLDYSFFYEYNMKSMLHAEVLPGLAKAMFALGVGLIVIGVPVLTYFFGKRWYCSWVCGCGGLAETAGDPFRHLSDKSLKAWRIERYLIHGVLVFAVFMTAGVLVTYLTGSSTFLGFRTSMIREWYGFGIGSVFAGVVGTGFYPLMGNRVWCRFGCPLAAYLGLVQRFKSRFRITTNGGQCISCGNCSTYCEQGIDVRWYAQRGQNIVRASCVGCGVCSAVCPRGVLNLENGPDQDRTAIQALHIGPDRIQVLS